MVKRRVFLLCVILVAFVVFFEMFFQDSCIKRVPLFKMFPAPSPDNMTQDVISPRASKVPIIIESKFRTKDNEFLKVNIKVLSQPTYMWSAIRSFRSLEDGKTNIILNTLDGTRNGQSETKFNCCVFYSKTGLTKMHDEADIISVFRLWGGDAPFLVTQYKCSFNVTQTPRLIAISSSHSMCPDQIEDYLPVVYPPKREGEIAVCIPPVHKTVNNQMLVEMLEYHRLMGVHKVFVYFLDAGRLTMNLLSYYSQKGFVELIPFEIPGNIKGKPDRHIDPPDAALPQLWQDIQFPVADCMERTSGYSFVGNFDIDELVVSKVEDYTFTKLFKVLTAAYPGAAGFTFIPEMFPLHWAATHPNSKLLHMKYRNRTEAFPKAPKSVHIPNKISYRNVHSLTEKHGYKIIFVPTHLATLHHYRHCAHQSKCHVKPNKTAIDKSLETIEKQWQLNVESVPSYLWEL